ncbi:MAG TPA: hypothetical protein VFG21_03705 [Xanthomonadaceae bacterium]|nr:hypothetical protein [Xanthomonadaceae bacterium]
MTRKFLLFAVALSVAAAAHAQRYSGDPWLDDRLGEVGLYARGDLDGFIDEVVVSFGAPRPVIREYIVDHGYPPADVYLLAGYANALGRPLVDVHEVYRANRGRGWGVISKELGIRPGSSAFHALKGTVRQRAPHWQGAAAVVHDGPGRGPSMGPPGKGRPHGKGKGKGKGRGKGR